MNLVFPGMDVHSAPPAGLQVKSGAAGGREGDGGSGSVLGGSAGDSSSDGGGAATARPTTAQAAYDVLSHAVAGVGMPQQEQQQQLTQTQAARQQHGPAPASGDGAAQLDPAPRAAAIAADVFAAAAPAPPPSPPLPPGPPPPLSSSSSAAVAATPAPPRRSGCRDVTEFHALECIGEGTYGVVTRARDPVHGGRLVALKKIRLTGETEGFPAWAVREIAALQALRHPNVVALHEVATSRPTDANRGLGDVFLVFEYVEADMAGLLRCARDGNTGFAMTEERVRSYMLQLLTGLAHMHARGWVHRDLKTANLLVTAGNVVKIADFGLAKPLEPGREMTPRVVTLWYRSPELLFQDRSAGPGVDVWSAGCIFGELLTGREVFVGRDELAQLHAIYKLCGVPDTATWPGLAQLQAYIAMRPKQKFVPQFKSRFGHVPPLALDLLERLLTMNPHRRISAAEALQHPYFTAPGGPPPPPPHTLPPITLATGHELEVRNADHAARAAAAAGGGGNGGQRAAAPAAAAAQPAGQLPLARKRKLSAGDGGEAAAQLDGPQADAKRRALYSQPGGSAAAFGDTGASSLPQRSESAASAHSGSTAPLVPASATAAGGGLRLGAAGGAGGMLMPSAVQSVLNRVVGRGAGGLPLGLGLAKGLVAAGSAAALAAGGGAGGLARSLVGGAAVAAIGGGRPIGLPATAAAAASAAASGAAATSSSDDSMFLGARKPVVGQSLPSAAAPQLPPGAAFLPPGTVRPPLPPSLQPPPPAAPPT